MRMCPTLAWGVFEAGARLLSTGGAMIEVTQVDDGDPLQFDVCVRAGRGETTHKVSVGRDTLARLGGSASGEAFVRAAFEFLLERESADSILARFDVTVIGRYFPEFEDEIGGYLD